LDELTLITSENFENITCDIYFNGGEFYMTREQIGTALGYSDPRASIGNIHARHKDRLDSLSLQYQIDSGPAIGVRDVVVYSRKGVMEICRWSGKPKANEFIDWVWNIMDLLIRGQANIAPVPPAPPLTLETDYQDMSAKSKLYNAQVRMAREYENLAKLYPGTDYAKILESHASKALSGEHLIPLPESDRKTYSATEIGEILGINKFKVGHLANQNQLKTKEYGDWFMDIVPGTHKQVQVFRYYDNVIPVFKKLLGLA